MTPSDAKEERTYVSISAEDVDAVSFAATAAAADLGSSVWPDFSVKGTCRVYIIGADCSLVPDIKS